MGKGKLLLLIFIFFFIAIVFKLFYLQVLARNSSLNSYLKYRKIIPERGKIYDRNKQPLVLNQRTFRLYAEPEKIKDKDDVIDAIDDVLELGESTIEARIDDSKVWVSIASDIEKEKRDKLLAKKLIGIGFEDQYRRYYPEASLAAHLLGFVGKNKEGESVGYFGLEGYYDKDLLGLPGLFKTERDLLGRPILIGTQEKIEPEDGVDLILSIDKTVQNILKTKLIRGMDLYGAKEGCIVTADPFTMEILGLVCLPDFDLDKYFDFSEDYFRNPIISSSYEPGSTFKPLIVAAAINEKKVKPNDKYNESGAIKIGEHEIRTWNNKYEGKISITRILEKSSNVGMVYIGDKLGKDLLYKYIKDYGFGELTGVDLQGELPGFLKSKNQWYKIDEATATFGQGIAITPIQMLRAFSALINGGELIKPTLVKKIINDKKEIEAYPSSKKRVIDKNTSDIIKKMLVSTVENGDAKWARPEGYRIGGKTGTAQIPVRGHYDPTKTIASFIGFAPYQKPKFITLVVLREPESSVYGSETAAPLFFEIAKELLVYYNIPPDR